MVAIGRGLAWPPLVYLILAIALTWPLAARLGVSLPSLGDPQQQAWILAWNAHALLTDPAHVWQAPIFYPYPDTLAYHDHLLIVSIVSAPLIWATGNPILAANVLLLLSFALTGWAVYSLALELSGQRWAAYVAGAAFAFCTFRISHLPHLNLLQTMWMPWALLYLRRLLQPTTAGGSRARNALCFGLFAGLQAANVLYYAFFALALLGGYVLLWAASALWRWARRRERLPWATAGYVLLGGGLAALISVPFMLPYLRLYQSLGIMRSVRELDNWSAPLTAYLAVAPTNLLYGDLGGPFENAGPEVSLFPGFLVAALALVALLRWRGREPLFWGLVAAGAFVLSLGTGVRLVRNEPPLPIPLPYPILYARLPGFGSMRVPARWGMLAELALVVLAAVALAMLLVRLDRRRRALAGGVALAIVLVEQIGVPVPTTDPALFQQAPPVYRWLGAPEQRDIRVVLELPVGKIPRGDELQRIMRRHFFEMYHWKALPVAYGALIPFGTTDLMAQVQRLPDDATLRYLQIVGVDTLIIHRSEYDTAALQRLLAAFEASPQLRRRAEVGDAGVYTLLPAADLLQVTDGAPGASIYISADERVPGLLALALARRWQEQGLQLYGSSRVRYYGPLGTPRAGQVFEYGLLADAEAPERYGFDHAGLRWRSNGLAFYARDPALRAALELGREPVGEFHRAFPAALDVVVQPDQLRAADVAVGWTEPISQAYLELDVASLREQQVMVGTQAVAVAPGASTIAAAVPVGQAIRVSGQPDSFAALRLRVRAAPPAPGDRPAPALAVSADPQFADTRLAVSVRTGGVGRVRLEVRGAAAYDDRPIQLLMGTQPVAPGGTLLFESDLLSPDAPWLEHTERPVDGRYIAYLRDADRPDAPGLPIAQFNIRGGALVDLDAVPLPLTALR
jgi:hypothetical protein